jgi:hypothetical protein
LTHFPESQEIGDANVPTTKELFDSKEVKWTIFKFKANISPYSSGSASERQLNHSMVVLIRVIYTLGCLPKAWRGLKVKTIEG